MARPGNRWRGRGTGAVVGARRDRYVVADDADQHAVGREGDVTNALANQRRIPRQGHFHHRRVPPLELEDPHEVTHRHGFFDQGRHQSRCRDGDVDAPGFVEHPVVLGVVDSGNGARHPKFGLREEGHDEIDLVVPGCRDDDITLGKAGLVEGVDLAGVGGEPVGLRGAFNVGGVCRLVDEQHLVVVVEQFAGDRAPNAPSPGNDDSHRVSVLRSSSVVDRWRLVEDPFNLGQLVAPRRQVDEVALLEDRVSAGKETLAKAGVIGDPGPGALLNEAELLPDPPRVYRNLGDDDLEWPAAGPPTVATVGMPSR